MPKSPNQKLRILYLYDYFIRNTDEEHMVSLEDIAVALSNLDIIAERKTLYDDFETLRKYGLDIISSKGKYAKYYALNPTFELPELKLLVDAVQSSKFITLKKANELISKIETLTSRYNAKDLQRQVYIGGSIKTVNEQIYYNVDSIYSAISKNLKISFKYIEADFKDELRFRRNGDRYYINPMALLWHDDNYYLLAYENENHLKHYRVDRINSISVEQIKREFVEEFKNVDMAKYKRRVFSMFGGTEKYVRLIFDNSLLSVVYDKFGKDIIINVLNENEFSINVNVEVSVQFYGWLAGLGSGVKISSPEKVKIEYINHLKEIINTHT